MQQIDDSLDTMIEDFWQAVEAEQPAAVAPVVPAESRIARFFNSLAASVALQRRAAANPPRHHQVLYPTDVLAQHYPQLYLRVMCG